MKLSKSPMKIKTRAIHLLAPQGNDIDPYKSLMIDSIVRKAKTIHVDQFRSSYPYRHICSILIDTTNRFRSFS